ncbi:MAG: S8 family serine peptidase [Opitutaceae bacterium]|nr:S8 family serine peptidase [Opitutaceae bacterium]
MHHPLVRIVDTVQRGVGGAEEVAQRVSMVADHVIATFPEGVTPAALAGTGLVLRERLLGTNFYLVSFPASDVEALPLILGALRVGGGLMASADADYVNYTMDLPVDSPVVTFPAVGAVSADEPALVGTAEQAQGIPNDAGFSSLWGMRNTGGAAGYVAGMDINATNAWNVRTDASSVIVAVIDTGIRTSHQDLVANIWSNPGEIGIDAQGRNRAINGVDDDGNGYVDDVFGINSITNTGLSPLTANDDHGHGTHCSGTIGGRGDNGVGVAGVCWKVQLMACKFLSATGSGYDSDAIQCLAYARAKGAKVTSNSWGGGGFSAATLTAIQQARDADVLFIAAAGNSGANNDVQANYPCGYNVENVVSVASMQGDGARSSFSCYGATTVDVAAPGSSIYSCSAASDTSYDDVGHLDGGAAHLRHCGPHAGADADADLCGDCQPPLCED